MPLGICSLLSSFQVRFLEVKQNPLSNFEKEDGAKNVINF